MSFNFNGNLMKGYTSLNDSSLHSFVPVAVPARGDGAALRGGPRRGPEQPGEVRPEVLHLREEEVGRGRSRSDRCFTSRKDCIV